MEYTDSFYYNYYRILEYGANKRNYQSGLVPVIPTIQNSNYKIQQVYRFTLDEFSINTEINDTCSISTWKQVYSNHSTQPVEAKYSLPLHPTSVISNFTAEYQGKIYHGKIKETRKAKDKYSDSIASGNQAFLATKTNDGFFTLSIGNIPKGEKVIIKLQLISEIGTHFNRLLYCIHKFMFPTNQFKFYLSVNCKLSKPIKNVTFGKDSGTLIYKYKDGESGNKQHVEISLKNGMEWTVKDNIVIEIEPIEQTEIKPNSIIEYNQIDKSHAVALSFYPTFKNIPIDEINQKSEFIFVLDCSGSMAGQNIVKAKRSLGIIIRSLNENHKFNVYCFGSRYDKVFEESLPYNDKNLEIVEKYISDIDATFGGTDLLPTMQDIFSVKFNIEYPRQIFVLTDGEVDNRDELINYVSIESNTTRLFTYGIGSDVDRELVIGLSKSCNGYYEFIQDNSTMENRVMTLLNIAFKPMLGNVKIDWGIDCNKLVKSGQIIQSNSIIRPIFNEERMIIYAIIKDSDKLQISQPLIVTLTCDDPTGNKLSFPIQLDIQSNSNSSISNSNEIHILAASKYIKELENNEIKNYVSNKSKIETLGKKYGLVSKYTSFIVTAESDKVTEESMCFVEILRTDQKHIFSMDNHNFGLKSGGAGSGGVDSLNFHLINSLANRTTSVTPQGWDDGDDDSGSWYDDGDECDEDDCEDDDMEVDYSNLSRKPVVEKSYYRPVVTTTTTPTPKVSTDLLIELLKKQKANGSWNKLSVVQFKIQFDKMPNELSSNEDIFVTLMVIAKITKTFPNEKIQWDLSISKSTKWIKQQLTKLNIRSDIYDSYLSTCISLL